MSKPDHIKVTIEFRALDLESADVDYRVGVENVSSPDAALPVDEARLLDMLRSACDEHFSVSEETPH